MFVKNSKLRVLFLAPALCLAAAWLSLTVAQTPGGSSTFTDTRDGKTYRTVKIGKQTWMAANLNYKPETGNSRCYDDEESNCRKYGRLYDWETAKAVCPAGWHLPSREEWRELVRAVDTNAQLDARWDNDNVAGKKLKSKSGWENKGNGTDEYGFSALPGGYRYYYEGNFLDDGSFLNADNDYDGSFLHAGNYGYWWAATEDVNDSAYYRGMGCNDDNVYEDGSNKSSGFSVRCLRD
jgi:uncharacterized protein (TIGR02145 family)